MSRLWEREAAADEVFTEVSDYKGAMYQLISHQVLYASDQRQARSYHVISRHRAAFESLASDMGLVLHCDSAYRYICVRPEDGLRQAALTKGETLFLLILAKIYDDRANNGAREDDGSALVSIEDFKSEYRGTLGVDFPGRPGDIKDQLASARRFGVARLRDDQDDPDQPFAIQILAAISFLVPVTVAGRIGADYQRSMSSDDGESEAEAEADAEGGVPNQIQPEST